MRKSRLLIIAITFLAASMLTVTMANATSRQSLNDSIHAEELSYVPGELIITLKKESNELAIRENNDFHSRMIDVIPNFENSVKWESAPLNTSLIKVKVGEELAQIKALKQNPNVESVELNTIQYERGHIISTDPDFSSQWHLNATNATGSWHYTTGSPNIIVAVIDTGIEWTHSDLSSGIWNNTDDSCTGGVDNDSNGKVADCRGWDFVNNDNNPTDDRGHGTFVAGIIGARLNTVFGASMAPNISLMPVKVLNSAGSGTLSNLLNATTYAVDNGADVINMSLGAYGPCSGSMQTAVNYANANGVVFVVAAGESAGTDIADSWPLCDHVISVTATDNLNESAHYSDWVDTNDLAAPGGDTLVSGGSVDSLPVASTYLNNTFAGGIGTSYATPHVSGCAALIKTLDSNFGADFIQSKMEESALDLTDSGYLPNLATFGKDKVFGWGLLQCDAALLTGVGAAHTANITSVAPISNSIVNGSFSAVYSLSKIVSSGTITFTRTAGVVDGGSHIYNFTIADEAPGSHPISRTMLETGFVDPLVSGAVYTMTVSATDYVSNVSTINNTSITYDNIPPVISSIVPAANLSVNQFNVAYTLSEAASSGTITFTQTGGAADVLSPHIYTLAAGDKTPGPHTISKTTLFGSTLVNGAVYTMTVSATDLASNVATVSNLSIAYSNTIGTCSVPPSVDWVISSGCEITGIAHPLGNINIQNGAIVTIESAGTLNIDSLTKYLKIHFGSGILIKSGGKIN